MQGTARAAGHAMQVSTVLLIAVAAAAGFWGVVQADMLTARTDNPRRVDAELATQRGSIVDRNGVELSVSALVATTNNVPRFQRVYSKTVAAPAVGYYSQRYGAGGMEAFADATLRGPYSRVDELLHRRRMGSPVTLTLDSELQMRLFTAISATNPMTVTRGAAVVMNWRTGEVLAMVSAPTFDANKLDAAWDALRTDPNAPLINRTTQGLYQPGMMLRWLAENKVASAKNQESRLDPSWLLALGSLNLDKPVPFELKNEAVPLPATATYSETIGQGQLRVTPLRIAATVASLSAGQPITPTLLKGQSSDLQQSNSQKRNLQPDTFITFAPISKDLHVGWLVQVKGDFVIVIALEQSMPDEPALRRVAQATYD
jgi:cell division protein FtsI/penicillin-binding protein 2